MLVFDNVAGHFPVIIQIYWWHLLLHTMAPPL